MTDVKAMPIAVANPEHAEAIRQLLAAAPPLTEDQRDTIRAAIRSARDLAGAR